MLSSALGSGVKHLGYQMHQHQGAVGVEFVGGVAAIVGKLLDPKLIGIAQLILRHIFQRQHHLRKMLQQFSL